MKATLSRKALFAGVLGWGIYSFGCGSDNSGVACTANIVYGVQVTIYDARTQQPAAAGATVSIREDVGDDAQTLLPVYTETLTAPINDSQGQLIGFQGAAERSGIYSVRIEKPGYKLFKSDVPLVVRRDVCHVIPVTLRAELTLNP